MKIKNLKLSVLSLLLLIAWTGCKDDEPLETDPSQIILGKWEIVEIGNYPDMRSVENPSGYKEYLPDSVLREYEYETGEYYYKKYSIDTLLHEYIYVPQKGQYMPFFEYSYVFADSNNKIYLKYRNVAAIFNDVTFKRIK
ncbi:hypothetical protein [Mariniphaga sp.]|uniref:hypothetical protein n=1 Tax=Mariniphaga sp. TaxID=1954475 RepID=UPI003566347E